MKKNRKMFLNDSNFACFLRTSRFVLCWAALIVCSALAAACNIPVFRFALERWKPDSCEIVVFHRGPMSVEDGEILEDLESASLAKRSCSIEWKTDHDTEGVSRLFMINFY